MRTATEGIFNSKETSLPPAQPLYVLRGHAAQINAVHFIRKNSRLLTCDSDGWVIMWKTSTRRPVGVWKAHNNAILGIKEWGNDKVITHGRDNKLFVWKLGPTDEAGLSMILPLENKDTEFSPAGGSDRISHHRAPWLLYSLDVNTLNFCGFSMCVEKTLSGDPDKVNESGYIGNPVGDSDSILLAVPSSLDSDSIDIMQLPSGRRVYSSIGISSSLESKSDVKTGMTMSLSLFYHSIDPSALMLVAGYESGHVIVYRIKGKYESEGRTANQIKPTTKKPFEIVYLHKTHSQPVLSVSVPSTHSYFLSSSADSLIVKHPLPVSVSVPLSSPPPQAKALNPSGYASGFSALSSAFASSSSSSEKPLDSSSSSFSKLYIPKDSRPIEILKTNHSSQQSLVIRNDDKLSATAGWDGRIRVYTTGDKKGSGKGKMKEVAVLKWHKEGCYACGFAEVLELEEHREEDQGKDSNEGHVLADSSSETFSEESAKKELVVVGRQWSQGEMEVVRNTVEQMREERETRRHWVVAGSKDGKVSLWEIY